MKRAIGTFVFVVLIAGAIWIGLDSGAPVRPANEWVPAASVNEIKGREVVYVAEHEVFVSEWSGPNGFMALSALRPTHEDADEPTRMLYCTLSNLFENQDGERFDRAGHALDESGASMARIPVRVRGEVVEVAPSRATENDLEQATYFSGPPCGGWGDVVEGPPGYALATDAPPEENRASISPTRVKVGQRAELHFAPGRQAAGLRWDLYRVDEDGLWQWRGVLVAGPGYESYFDLPPLDRSIDDIGFDGRYSMDIEIPKLAPGTYRLATESIENWRSANNDRYVWHYADFEVVDD